MAEDFEEPIEIEADEEERVEEPFITTKSDEDVVNKTIKETTLELFAIDGFASGFTEEINGFLDCIVIESSHQIQIQITMERYPDVVLLQLSDFHGQKYISLRNKTISPNGEMFNFQADKWSLNDGLRVEINGPKGSQAHFVFKYS